MDWARVNGYVVFTHDLDFGALLAVTHAEGPSVIQVRTQDVTPDHLAPIVINALRQYFAGPLVRTAHLCARLGVAAHD